MKGFLNQLPLSIGRDGMMPVVITSHRSVQRKVFYNTCYLQKLSYGLAITDNHVQMLLQLSKVRKKAVHVDLRLISFSVDIRGGHRKLKGFRF